MISDIIHMLLSAASADWLYSSVFIGTSLVVLLLKPWRHDGRWNERRDVLPPTSRSPVSELPHERNDATDSPCPRGRPESRRDPPLIVHLHRSRDGLSDLRDLMLIEHLVDGQRHVEHRHPHQGVGASTSERLETPAAFSTAHHSSHNYSADGCTTSEPQSSSEWPSDSSGRSCESSSNGSERSSGSDGGMCGGSND